MDPLETLYEALQHPLGLVVSTENPISFRLKLYTAMRQHPELACFTIHLSRTRPESEIFLIRKESSDGL